MSAQLKSRRDEVAEHIVNLCKTHAEKEGCRVKRLNDAGARDAVINGAAWRCVQAGDVFGNIRDYIEEFWYEDGAQRDALIDRALDAERQAYKRASKASGGTPAGELIDYSALDNLWRHTEDGNVFAPEQVIEQQGFEAEEAAADDAREKIEAEENERLRLARNAYGETLPIRHRRALFLICSEPTASNSTIAAQVGMRSVRGIKPETVSKIRDKLTELANGILTKSPEDLYMEELERLADIAKAEAEVRRAESRLRRAQWVLTLSVEELAKFRAFAEPLCDALGMSIDDLLGASIAPKAAS
jgi:hypothetical protein